MGYEIAAVMTIGSLIAVALAMAVLFRKKTVLSLAIFFTVLFSISLFAMMPKVLGANITSVENILIADYKALMIIFRVVIAAAMMWLLYFAIKTLIKHGAVQDEKKRGKKEEEEEE